MREVGSRRPIGTSLPRPSASPPRFRPADAAESAVIRAVFIGDSAILDSEGAAREGAAAFLRGCAERFPLIVITGRTRAAAIAALESAGLAPMVLDVLPAEEVENPPPAPDLLVAALGRLGFLLRDRNPVEPSQCLVVERRDEGVEAARRTGMWSLRVGIRTAAIEADFEAGSFGEIDLDGMLRRCAARRA